MDEPQVKGNYLDYFSANKDFKGSRRIEDTQEFVNFSSGSTVRIWLNHHDDNFESHWHNAMEIIMPVENYYDVTADEAMYHILPGEILIIPPCTIHAIISPESGQRFIYLFDISLISKLKGFASIQSLLISPVYITPVSFPAIYKDVYELLVQIRNEYFSMTEFNELTIYSQLLSLFVKLGLNQVRSHELFAEAHPHRQKEYIQKFNDLMDYIDSHYTEDLNVNDAANSMGFSKYHFSRLFKQYTGKTFCDYLTNRRIRVAEGLLGNSELSVTDISIRSGFSSISTFNRLFKQQTGYTPSQYRSRQQSYVSDTAYSK